MGPSWRSLAAAVLLLGTAVMGCKDAEAPQPDPDVVAIRRMIGDWERSMELDDEPALQPLFADYALEVLGATGALVLAMIGLTWRTAPARDGDGAAV